MTIDNSNAKKTTPVDFTSGFQSLGLHEELLIALADMKFITPTPIQEQTIPSALQGLDVLGTAQTGTGKTGAYGIPLVSYLFNNPKGMALVLTPTRELAVQVLQMLDQLMGKNKVSRTALLIGGESMPKQLKQLGARPRLIVGTPGRINDHLTRGSLKLNACQFLVLDETDRMLDMGFGVQLQKIVKFLPPQRQTLMFSATMAPNIIKITESYQRKDVVRVSVGSTTLPMDKIKQENIRTTEAEKYDNLMTQLNKSEGTFIVFSKTKHGSDRLASKLRNSGHNADAIHGDLRQRERDRVIKDFRNGSIRVLVATDIAARGLDIPHIEVVVNYDLPQCPEDYIHRIGRTGRAGADGMAVNLITNQDNAKWRAICKLMDPAGANDSADAPPHLKRKNKGGSGRSPSNNEGRSRSSGGARHGGGSRREGGNSSEGRQARPSNGEGRSAGNGPRREGGEGRPKKAGFSGGHRGQRSNSGGNSNRAA
ncbi:MAG: DEAD/DEAH box helicase [Alphaproteobacteria bacterium]|nr:DEAD/DEAH box helicase [Alphaproteobacteria bacterium]